MGQMSSLINQAFEIITKEAGKAKSAFLIIDEADSLSAMRDTGQSHHEDKVAVNTIIQKVDDLRRFGFPIPFKELQHDPVRQEIRQRETMLFDGLNLLLHFQIGGWR